MTSTTCKDDCEALMGAVLPVAERMLLEQRACRVFGSTLSADGGIAQVGGWAEAPGSAGAGLLAEFEASFRAGAARGELRATALIQSVPMVPVDESQAKDAVAIRLDHRDDYSIVVTFPYWFSAAGELTIDEPFASAGAHDIFPRTT